MGTLEDARLPSLYDEQIAQEKAERERLEKERLEKERLEAAKEKKLGDGKKKGRKTEKQDE